MKSAAIVSRVNQLIDKTSFFEKKKPTMKHVRKGSGQQIMKSAARMWWIFASYYAFSSSQTYDTWLGGMDSDPCF